MNIGIIQAGAGSGKTYRLAQEVFEAVRDGRASPERILLTTFTRKAAAELTDRVGARLIKEGLYREASAIREARIGTVHSVCGSLLRDFAFEAGLALRQTVLDEAQSAALFRRALSGVLEDEDTEELGELSYRLTVGDWRSDVEAVVKAARSNAIAAERLPEIGRENRDRLFEQLGPEADGFSDFPQILFTALDALGEAARAAGDGTKATAEVVSFLESCAVRLRQGRELSWAEYLKLAGLSPAKKSAGVLDELNAAAYGHCAWPEFRRDLGRYIELVFSLAARAFARYRELKQTAGYLDFEDQEALCLDLLEREDIAGELKFDLVLVDEFQDTSPIQLALFLRLADRASRSIWVGDPKQAIYGFRGCDPALMMQAVNGLSSGGTADRLKYSWRSVPQLVEYVNDTFSRAFTAQGIDPESVPLIPQRERTPDIALESWVLGKGSRARVSAANDFDAIAAGVRDLLSEGEIGPSDIAVLARKNSDCAGIAEALAKLGIPFSRETAGLVSEPAAELLLSAFTLILSPEDSLAAAKVSWLCGLRREDFSPVSWLSGRLDEVTAGKRSDAFSGDPVVQALRAEHERIIFMTPADVFLRAAEVTGVRKRSYLSGSPRKHAGIVEQLFGFVREYEEASLQAGEPLSHSGLLSAFRELAETGEDVIAESGEDGVKLCTWHASKGLEWPVVILYGLDSPPKVRYFGTDAVSSEDFDLLSPLFGRSIRFTPFPYRENQKKNCLYLELLQSTPAYAVSSDASLQEHVRLLYVAFTRARNRLIFARRQKSAKKREDDTDGAEAELFSVPPDAETAPPGWLVRELSSLDEMPARPPNVAWFPYSAGGRKEYQPRSITPSSLRSGTAGEFLTAPPLRFSDPLSLSIEGTARTAFGIAVHRFFAVRFRSDGSEETLRESLHVIAGRLLEASRLTVDPAVLVALRERFDRFLSVRWPGYLVHRELPLYMERNGRTIEGYADLVLESGKDFSVVDYKLVSPEDTEAGTYAERYGPQISAYAEVLESAFGKPCSGMYLCLPFLGQLIEVKKVPSGVAARE